MEKYLKSITAGQPRVYEASSVSEFIEIATWLYGNNSVIFRGQSQEHGWPLIPSIGRDAKYSMVLQREEEILAEFKRESIPYVHSIPESDWQWLALAQHNRLPTRLLDWTKNPLAALWFAVKDPAVNGQPGIVWAFGYEKEDVVFNTAYRDSPFSIDRTYVYFPEHVSHSIQAQSGLFTIHHRTEDGSFLPFDHTEYSERLAKIEIRPELFWLVRYHLFRVGINPATLFPGLLGLAEKIRYENMRCKDDGNG